MIHEILLDEEASLVERSGRLIVDLAGSTPGSISLGLALLSEALVDDLTLRPPRSRWAIRLRKSAELCVLRGRRYGNQRVELVIGQVELDRWFVFFLKYFRDGCAEVDHLDAHGAWDTGASFDFTLRVSMFVPPVSEDEARKRLGMKSRG
jgi:hypothetical protein